MSIDPPEKSPPPPAPKEPTPSTLEEAQLRSNASREKLRGLVKEMEQAIEDSEKRRDETEGESQKGAGSLVELGVAPNHNTYLRVTFKNHKACHWFFLNASERPPGAGLGGQPDRRDHDVRARPA
jgi:hypothetical protein